VFLKVRYFLLAQRLMAFLHHIRVRLNVLQMQKMEMIIITLSIQFITSLMLSNFFILAVIFRYFRVTPIPTMEGFSIAHVEKLQCLLTKSPSTCKVILYTRSNRLDAFIWIMLFTRKNIVAKFEPSCLQIK
jgi:hypothetical protein